MGLASILDADGRSPRERAQQGALSMGRVGAAARTAS